MRLSVIFCHGISLRVSAITSLEWCRPDASSPMSGAPWTTETSLASRRCDASLGRRGAINRLSMPSPWVMVSQETSAQPIATKW